MRSQTAVAIPSRLVAATSASFTPRMTPFSSFSVASSSRCVASSRTRRFRAVTSWMTSVYPRRVSWASVIADSRIS